MVHWISNRFEQYGNFVVISLTKFVLSGFSPAEGAMVGNSWLIVGDPEKAQERRARKGPNSQLDKMNLQCLLFLVYTVLYWRYLFLCRKLSGGEKKEDRNTYLAKIVIDDESSGRRWRHHLVYVRTYVLALYILQLIPIITWQIVKIHYLTFDVTTVILRWL